MKTATGQSAFHSANLKKILMRWRYAGIREDLGEPVGPAVWPAIVTEDELRAVRATLMTDEKRPYLSRTYMLKGLLVCGQCGHRMQGNYGSKGLVRYQCQKQANITACGKTTVQARYLEPWIWEQFYGRVDKDDLAGAGDPSLSAQAASD
ncbi:MAG: zinc ribbon domain-containing protein [Thermoleophilia bacterium]